MTRRSTARSPRTTAATAAPEATFEMALAVIVILALFTAAWMSGLSTANAEPTRTERVRVRAGDTLWSLAASHPAAGRSTAETADLLASMNGLESAVVVEGQVLSVPASSASDSEVALR